MAVYTINGVNIDDGFNFGYLHSKAYYALGDSIVLNSGTKLSPVTVSNVVLYGYTQALEDRYGFICTNYGLSNHTVVQDFSTLNAMDYSQVAFVTIGYGVNDGRLNVPLGTRASADTTTFAGALGTLIQKIYTDNKACRILVLTPIQRLLVNSWGSYTQNQNGNTLEDFAKMCIDVANYYGTPCVDLFHNSGINSSNLSIITFDGVHPNNQGYNHMANAIVGYTDNLFMISTNMI